MKYSVLMVAFLAFVLVSSGCASAPTFVAPDGPFLVLDGKKLVSGGNLMLEDEAWFRIMNVFNVDVDNHTGDFSIVDIEKDTGIRQDDFEGKSYSRMVVMVARPSTTHALRTNDGTHGIILVNESSGRAAEVTKYVLDGLLSGVTEVEAEVLDDLPDNNVVIVGIANGERDGEIVIRKRRRESDRSFLCITNSLASILSSVGYLFAYIPTEEELPRFDTEERDAAADQEADDIIRELDEQHENNKGDQK